MARRDTLGRTGIDNLGHLDRIIEDDESEEESQSPSPASREKQRLTVYVPVELAERARNIVYWERLTLANFGERALRALVEEYEEQNEGQYEQRPGKLPPGRPMQ